MAARYHCPVELTMDVVGGKWRPVILAPVLQAMYDWGLARAERAGATIGDTPA